VKIVKENYPDRDIRVMDARDLSGFGDKTFDFVNFSFNGIDYVDDEGREKIFFEIWRILKPGGIFFFSTHNKAHPCFINAPWSDPTQTFITNLKTAVKLLPFFPRHILNKKKEVHAEGYSIINDSAHNYSLLTFYTDPDFLRKQLSAHQFSKITLLTKNGESENKLDDWIFVTCEKSEF
jgi:SAM-dependent methyltransferase